MKCRHARHRILLALDEEFSVEERLELEAHLRECAACAAEERRALALTEAFESWAEPPQKGVDLEQATRQIGARVERITTSVAAPRISSTLLRVAVAAGLILFAGAALLFFGSSGREHEPDEGGGHLQPAQMASGAALSSADASSDLASQGPGGALVPSAAAARVEPGSEPIIRVAEPEIGTAIEIDRVTDVLRVELRRAWVERSRGAPLTAFADAFDRETSEYRTWPRRRIVASFVDEAELALAQAACRYLGLRGDRLSVTRLTGACDRLGLTYHAIAALGDLGELGIQPLSLALRSLDRSTTALAALERIGGPRVVHVLEAALEDQVALPPGRRTVEPERLLAALRGTGEPAAVAALLRLAEIPALEGLAHLDGLAELEGAGHELTRLLRNDAQSFSSSVLFAAVGALQPPEALSWVEARCQDYTDRHAALACLVEWRSPTAVDVLLRLDAGGHLSADIALASFRTLADRDASLADRDEGRLALAAERLSSSDDGPGLDRFLELAIASGHPAVADALLVLALAPTSSPDPRRVNQSEWSVLALAELGDEEHGRALMQAFDDVEHLGVGNRRLAASFLIAIHALLPADGVTRVLAGCSRRSLVRVHGALEDVAERGAGAVAVHRVARAMDGALLSQPRPRSIHAMMIALSLAVFASLTNGTPAGAAVQEPGQQASPQGENVLRRYDLRGLLPRFDRVSTWRQALVVSPGDLDYDLPSPSLFGMYADAEPEVILDLLTHLLGEELNNRGVEVSLDGDLRLIVLAPKDVQARIRGVLGVLERAISGSVELEIDLLTLPEGGDGLVGDLVLERTAADRLVETLIGRGAGHMNATLRLTPGRTAVIDQRTAVPFLHGYDIEIAQGAFIWDPVVVNATEGIRVLARGVSTASGLELALTVVQSELAGELTEHSLSMRGSIGDEQQGGYVLFPGPEKFQSVDLLTRSMAFKTFIPDGGAIVVSTETHIGGKRSHQVMILRLGPGSAEPFIAHRIDGTSRKLILVNTETFSPPELSIEGTNAEDPEWPHPLVVASLNAEPSLFLFDWMKYRFNVWRSMGPWAIVVTDPAWDNQAGDELERLFSAMEPNVKSVQVDVELVAEGGGANLPVRWSFPMLAGSNAGAVIGRTGTTLSDFDVEVAQFAASPDPVMISTFDGLALGLALSEGGASSGGGTWILDVRGRGQHLPVPVKTFEPGGAMYSHLEQARTGALALDERVAVPRGGAEQSFRLGPRSRKGDQEGLSLEVRVRD